MTYKDAKAFTLASIKLSNNKADLVKLRLALESNGTLQIGDEGTDMKFLRRTLLTEDGRFRWSALSSPIRQWERDLAIQGRFFSPNIHPAEKADYRRKLTKLRLLRHYPLDITIEELRMLVECLKATTPAYFQELLWPLTKAEVALGRSEHWIIEPGNLTSEELRRTRNNLNEVLSKMAMTARVERQGFGRTNDHYAIYLLAQTLEKWTKRRREAADAGNLATWQLTWGRKLQKRFTKWSLKYVWGILVASSIKREIDFCVDVAVALDTSGLADDVKELCITKTENPYKGRRLNPEWKWNDPYNWFWEIDHSPSEACSTSPILATPASFLLRNLVDLECGEIEKYKEALRAASVMSA